MVHAGKESKPERLTLAPLTLSRKPLVLTGLKSGSRYMENGKRGVPVPYGDTAAPRNRIGLLLEHPQAARAIGKGACQAAALSTVERCSVLIWRRGLELVPVRSAAGRPFTPARTEV